MQGRDVIGPRLLPNSPRSRPTLAALRQQESPLVGLASGARSERCWGPDRCRRRRCRWPRIGAAHEAMPSAIFQHSWDAT
jgi:hypothetical protein